MLGGQEEKAEGARIGRVRQASLERPARGATPGGVAVEAEDDRVGEANELLHVLRRARGAERRHGVLEARLRQRDDVHVALDDQRVAALADRRARLEQAVELAALAEHGRLGGVQVLRLAAIENAAAESDHRALHRPDRKHDPVAEAVIALSRRGARERRPAVARPRGR